jgi:hypothetical protein
MHVHFILIEKTHWRHDDVMMTSIHSRGHFKTYYWQNLSSANNLVLVFSLSQYDFGVKFIISKLIY